MANIVISNNGKEARAEYIDENGETVPAVPATATIRVTDANGVTKDISPNVSIGFAMGVYTIEVV